MIIALASPQVASSLNDGLDRVKHLLTEAAAQQAELVCFPEAYLPGLRDRTLKFQILMRMIKSAYLKP
jgi:predicted amidohydrolase